MSDLKKITFSIDSRLDFVCLVGLSIRGICTSTSLSQEQVFGLELAVCEAVNNSIEHSYSGQEDQKIDVEVLLYAKQIIIHVIDYGQSCQSLNIDKKSLEADACTLQEIEERGRGLGLICELMDECSYLPGEQKNVFVLKKYI